MKYRRKIARKFESRGYLDSKRKTEEIAVAVRIRFSSSSFQSMSEGVT